LDKSSAGIAGKDFGEIRSLWPETVIAFSTAASINSFEPQTRPLFPREAALVALAGRHVKWTRLAVQQQRFEPDSNADQTNVWCHWHRCIYLRFIDTDLIRTIFDTRNS
jgi:hypothetical protein